MFGLDQLGVSLRLFTELPWSVSMLPQTRLGDGIHLAPFEQGEIGPDLFRHACLMGLEGLVSKHRDSPYRGGRFDRWVKVKNRQHPAFSRVPDQFR